jgi:hypothetical protein
VIVREGTGEQGRSVPEWKIVPTGGATGPLENPRPHFAACREQGTASESDGKIPAFTSCTVFDAYIMGEAMITEEACSD